MSLVYLENDTKLDGALMAIRQAILDNVFPPGSRLKQSQIAEQLGISQGPVREALARLVEEGLVENIPYRGMLVRQLTKQDVEEIYQVRIALECLAALRVVPKLREGNNLDTLKQLIQRIVEDEKAGNYDAAVVSDLEFHRFLVRLSANSHLIKVWDSLLAQSHNILRRLYALEGDESARRLALNHVEVLDALESGDSVRIRSAIEEHMNFGVSTLLRNWDRVTDVTRSHVQGEPMVR